ncbi:aflatoxin regulatory protein-domain-containing protein [Cercophora scortea]|uniref:Aflatoxin regulatory protein-domain-containing protein n=1 Tax=Cercophora scortea TaxID=314031 RepID=A0AAE0IPU4_9PEZI|nr:aflatoxin regulatory protein-domain-containing protein [Cercophora scortea]
MAAIPPFPVNTPSASRAAAALRLRDSCHGCASSKVKCPREKPTCSRCLKRNIACEYIATKRGSRKHSSDFQAHSSSRKHLMSCDDVSAPLAAATPHSLPQLHVLPTLDTWFASNPSTLSSGVSASTSPTALDFHPTQSIEPEDFSNLFPNVFSRTSADLPSVHGHGHGHTTHGDHNTANLDDFFASLLPNSAQADAAPAIDSFMFDTGMLNDPSMLSTGLEMSSLESSSSGSSSCSNGPNPALEPSPSTTVDSDTFPDLDNTALDGNASRRTSNGNMNAAQQMADLPCSCLVQALGLLQQLFPHPSTACSTSGTHGSDAWVPPTIETVIVRNKHTVESISAMLQCACSQDGHLLAIISHIVFKLLDWYAVAARKATVSPGGDGPGGEDIGGSGYPQLSSAYTSRSSSPFSERVRHTEGRVVIGSFCLDGANSDSDRMAAQLVLGELHRVQRLVNELSVKLKTQAAQSSSDIMADTMEPLSTTSSCSGFGPRECGEVGGSMLPFSGAILDILETDLKKRLKALSTEIVDGLMRE